MRLWYYKMGCMHFIQVGHWRTHLPQWWPVQSNQFMPMPPTWHNHPFFTASR